MNLDKDLKYTPRKEQQECLDFITSTIKEDPSKKFFLLDMPTGVGKSYLAMMFMDWYGKNISRSSKFDVITCQKVLQKQYTDDFESITNLWGADNYQCSEYSSSCKQGKEFSKLNKTKKCENCPYDAAKSDFMHDKIGLTNFHLYILYSLYRQDILEHRNSEVLIVDEAHDMESILSDFITVKLTDSQIKRLKFTSAYQMSKNLNRINTLEDFVSYLRDYMLGEIGRTQSDLKRQLMGSKKQVNRDLKMSDLIGDMNDNSKRKIVKAIGDLETYRGKVEHFIEDYDKNSENWVLEITKDKKGINELSVEPIWSHDYLNTYIWSKYKYVILMSGTILDKKMFSYINGLNGTQTAFYQIDSPFKVKNRPIYYMPAGRMTFKTKEATWNKYRPWIDKLMKKYKDDKGIIHTNTYELAEWIKRDVKDKRILHHQTDNKDQVLRQHYVSAKPTVLCSPSMTTGVNLEDDRARFQILLKVPYPSLASKKNKLRMKQMPEWYQWRTICTILQSYGRAVRNYDDKADFLIMDGCFKDVMTSPYIPNYVKLAIKRVDLYKHQT